jgi:signal transduction histidine kinase
MGRMTTQDDLHFQLDFLFQTAAEGILIIRSNGFLARLNPAASSMLGIAPDQALGEHTSALFADNPTLIRLCTGSGVQQGDITLPHQRLALGVSADSPAGGRILLLHDVTERHALDSRREALIHQIAHDFRNPLNAVSAYTDLIGKFGDLDGEQTRFLDRVRQTAQKLYDLAETLVDLAWVEAGMAITHQPFELAHLIREAIDMLTPEARLRDITLVFSLQDPVPTVIGDPRRIQQAIICLVKNGIRYSHPKSNVAIHAWQEGPKIFCSVGDQGMGIAPDEQDKVWDRMYRASDERVRAIPGGGIGLTFARAIVERHGGRIWIESALDVGTTVTFMLPLAEGW